MEDIITAPVICAFLGALSIKLLELAEIHKIPKTKRPDIKEFVYWVPFFVLPSIGAFLAFAYIASGQSLNPILAINVGVSAPLAFRTMAEVLPIKSSGIDPGPGA